MINAKGFTLIELIIFIVVTSILATTILLAFSSVLRGTPSTLEIVTANQTAQQCMEWYIGQRNLLGYDSIAIGTSVPTYCSSNTPSGYTTTVNVAATTINTDSNFKTITVTVSGTGSGDASLTTLIADY
jgi:Tfp pilus assembly protein PilE